MLVLSRQRDESIIIGNCIEVVVVDIRGDKVRIGTKAPRDVSVHRKEIFEAVQNGEVTDGDTPISTGIDLQNTFGFASNTTLTLSRNIDETIMIGDEIAITVVDIRGDKVRLGIAAPTKFSIHRKEIYEAIQQEQDPARSAKPDTAANDTGDELPPIGRTVQYD